MAPDRTRSAKRGDKLRLAATTIDRDSGCAGPNCSKGRSLPEQFLHQRSFQHHAFRPHANTDRNTNCDTYCYAYHHSNGNADTDCYTNSDGYSFSDAHGYTDNHAKAYTHATARTDAKASSVTSAQTVSDCLTMSGSRLLHGIANEEHSFMITEDER
jgi:hypothetical protein